MLVKILFLNKAISTIDNLIKILIYKLLKSQAEGRITLIITYRLNTIRDTNKIIAFIYTGYINTYKAEKRSPASLLRR